ncbi:MAG: dicarboxylate/amino acid:cation symporter [Tissierellia bacterium]|nr:dicarboxylate/amino acid:cation symporter [Tissierellia bacterium]
MEKKQIWKNYRLPITLLLAIALGSIIGAVYGEKATVLKPFGDIFINMMFTAVVPLVFVSVASAVGNMANMKRLRNIIGNMFLVFVITGIIAALIIITVVKIAPPAAGVNLSMETGTELEKLNFGEQVVKALTVGDFNLLLSKSNMLPLIVFSIIFGICVSALGPAGAPVAKLLESLSKVFMKFIDILMLYAPIGLGAYFANLVGEFGPQLLGAYAKAMAIYYPLCFLYFFIAFPIYGYVAAGKEGAKRLMKHILPPGITAFATGSSIATMPVNLEAAKKIGIPSDISEIVLPIGATMHMDGTVFSSILKISFLFGIFGQPFAGASTYLTAIAVSVMGGVVMSGVPGGGLIGEMLIVNLYGFPPEAFPIIATIGFLVDPPATMINAAGDTVASMVVARLVEGKDWLKKAVS